MAQDEKVKKLIIDYLAEARLMQIATVNGTKPWVATVWYANDKQLNLYFVSRRSRRHSMELVKNLNVAGTIVKPHVEGSGEKVRGLQFEGTGKECSNKEFKLADELYRAKFPSAARVPPAMEGTANMIATFYTIKPARFVLFDEVNFPEDPRQGMEV